jgi:hypothetical protein
MENTDGITTRSLNLDDSARTQLATEWSHFRPDSTENAKLLKVSSESHDPVSQQAPSEQGAATSPTHIHRGIKDPTGSRQVVPYAKGLKNDTNDQFVNQIEHDCAVGPHLEWSIAGGTILAKSLAKGWVLGKASESLGPAARAAGYGTGVALGVVTGFYTAYETAELLENSCKAHAFEERLRQTGSGTQTIESPGLDPISQTYEIERSFPSVRTVVDFSRGKIASLTGLGAGHSPADKQAELEQKAFSKNGLDDSAYISWAHKESSWSLESMVKRDAGFMALGAGGGYFAATKLHLGWHGKAIATAGGAMLGLGLSHLGIAADQDTKLTELLKARLLSKPHDRPNP